MAEEDHILHLPPGFRFHPTDEELITYYLTNKLSNLSFTCNAISVVDLNKCEPWDLPHKATLKGEKEWYFFCLKDRKYPTGLRTNRATEAGYWKTTGRDKEIVGSGRRDIIGMKKTLVFYKGRAPSGEKSNWVIHEYRLDDTYSHSFKSTREEWVVCRVFQKSAKTMKPNSPTSSLDQSPSENLHYSSSNQGPEFADFELTNFNPYTNPNPNSCTSSPQYVFPNRVYEDNPASAFVQGGDRKGAIEGMNTMCNWISNPEASYNDALSGNNGSLSLWPVSASNIAMSSLILKAVQLKNAFNRQQQQLMGEAAVSSSKQVMDHHQHQGFDDWGSYLMNELDN